MSDLPTVILGRLRRWLEGENLGTSAPFVRANNTLSDAETVAACLAAIDDNESAGLAGTHDSLGYRIEEIEAHLHGAEHWFGRDAGGTELAVENGMTGWTLTAGTGNAFGAWVQITDGTQFTIGEKFDAHRIMVKAVSAQDKVYLVQFGTGESGAQEAITTLPFYAPSNQVNAGPVDAMMNRHDNTDKLWARCACETNGATIEKLVGVHFYPG